MGDDHSRSSTIDPSASRRARLHEHGLDEQSQDGKRLPTAAGRGLQSMA